MIPINFFQKHPRLPPDHPYHSYVARQSMRTAVSTCSYKRSHNSRSFRSSAKYVPARNPLYRQLSLNYSPSFEPKEALAETKITETPGANAVSYSAASLSSTTSSTKCRSDGAKITHSSVLTLALTLTCTALRYQITRLVRPLLPISACLHLKVLLTTRSNQ